MSRKVIFVDMVTVRQQLGIAPQDINVRFKDIVQNSPVFFLAYFLYCPISPKVDLGDKNFQGKIIL